MSSQTMRRFLAYGLLLLVCAVSLAVPLYNRETPALFGITFFVWFQTLWIVVTAVATGLAYRLLRH